MKHILSGKIRRDPSAYRGRGFGLLMILLMLLVGCQSPDDAPIPTSARPDAVGSEIAQNATATQEALATFQTPIPSPRFVPTYTDTPSLTPTSSLIPSITVTPIPSPTLSRTPIPTLTPRPTDTSTPPPTHTPEHILNPDAVVKPGQAALLAAPDLETYTGITMPHLTSLNIEERTPDSLFMRVTQIGGDWAGWVSSGDVIIFIPLDSIPISTSSIAAMTDLQVPPGITLENEGDGLPFKPYDYRACGDTYWTGDQQTYSMETFGHEGRYPRFTRPAIRLFVYYGEGVDPAQWERVIAETLAQLSQAVRIERVYPDDLTFFQPAVAIETLLADVRVDMIWHILPPSVFEQAKPCQSRRSCSQYGFEGLVTGGPLNFGGMVYVPANAERKRAVLTHAAVHALGLWVHSPYPDDLMYSNYTVSVLSPRDVNTLRCLYLAPPYGDGNLP